MVRTVAPQGGYILSTCNLFNVISKEVNKRISEKEIECQEEVSL